MKYTVYQINLSDDQYKVHREAYLNTIFKPTENAIIKARDLYKRVAEITADSLNQVFEIGNVGPEFNIKRIAPMHSISVGDVILDENGDAFFVAPFGFKSIDIFAKHFAKEL